MLTANGRVKSKKEQRVVDHFVFERTTPPKAGWKLKERVETTMPAFLVEEKSEVKAGGRPGTARR